MLPEDQKIKQIFQNNKYLIFILFFKPALTYIIVKRLIVEGTNSKELMSELKVS